MFFGGCFSQENVDFDHSEPGFYQRNDTKCTKVIQGFLADMGRAAPKLGGFRPDRAVKPTMMGVQWDTLVAL